MIGDLINQYLIRSRANWLVERYGIPPIIVNVNRKIHRVRIEYIVFTDKESEKLGVVNMHWPQPTLDNKETVYAVPLEVAKKIDSAIRKTKFDWSFSPRYFEWYWGNYCVMDLGIEPDVEKIYKEIGDNVRKIREIRKMVLDAGP